MTRKNDFDMEVRENSRKLRNIFFMRILCLNLQVHTVSILSI